MRYYLLILILALPLPGMADPAMECSAAETQVDVRRCLERDEERANSALSWALGYARDASDELDEVTGRQVVRPALETGQMSWLKFRNKHCDFVGATFGGGSGTGIAVLSCHINLTRDRVEALMQYAQ
ncbi:lysozyme inhibitor LprI family protein [Phaeobacter sp. C3_T13_0]|uniref:lysozyme inhibitor LprI family protein n=1 Tax=Phaeobacter cretensis TaxID=3342641 RepID=UPI0039BD4948